jgi:hypothetical protein
MHMKRILVPTTGVEDWRRLLADPEKHWRTGSSAKCLAHCWEDADGFPAEIKRLFSESGIASFREVNPLNERRR